MKTQRNYEELASLERTAKLDLRSFSSFLREISYSNLLAFLCVIFSLIYFATAAKSWFTSEPKSVYSSLAEGFRTGKLGLSWEPSKDLSRLANPYIIEERHGVDYIWDASYYKGKYYLYFSPLPVLIFYLPVRLLFGVYPTDFAVNFYFSFIAICFWVLFLKEALKKPVLPLWIWTLAIGLATHLPYSLARYGGPYYVAIFSGVATTGGWSYFLLRFNEKQNKANALWLGLWLGLSVFARPNLFVLVLVTALLLRKNFAARWAIVPLACVGIVMASYNYLRFADIFEFGVKYQLSFAPLATPFRLSSVNDCLRYVGHLMHYLFWIPDFHSEFPYLGAKLASLGVNGGIPFSSESVLGLFPTIPFVAVGIGSFIAVKFERDKTLESARIMLIGSLFAFLVSGSVALMTARYTLDYIGPLTLGAILGIEKGLKLSSGGHLLKLRICILMLIIYSITIKGLNSRAVIYSLHPNTQQTV